MNTRYFVDYGAGESRSHPGKAVDYMIAAAEDQEGEAVELYAEAEPEEDETGTYNSLKDEILDQAAASGILADQLKFFYD